MILAAPSALLIAPKNYTLFSSIKIVLIKMSSTETSTPLLNCTGVFGFEDFAESLEIASASGGSHPSGNSNLSSEKNRSFRTETMSQ